MNKSLSTKSATEAGLTNNQIQILIKIAKEAAILGGDSLISHYGRINMIRNKGREGDLVTNADIETEKIIIDYLTKKTPDISLIAEESGIIGKTDELAWCIDPLDGTTNFTHGYPLFATSIGLIWKGVRVMGAISIPFLKEMYWGAPKLGVYKNQDPIRVSSTKALKDSLLVTGFAYDRHQTLDNNYAEFCWLTHKTQGVRRGGAAAVDLAFVAAGRIDGYWERGLSPWDLAAGVALVDLAGGVITDYKGLEFNINSGRVLAACEGITNEMLIELSMVKPLMGEQFGAPQLDS